MPMRSAMISQVRCRLLPRGRPPTVRPPCLPLANVATSFRFCRLLDAGTTSTFFTVGNATKALPWLLLAKPGPHVWMLMALCLPAIPGGIWLGWRFHARLDQQQMYRICYALLVVTALKLLWDGLSGHTG